MIPDVVTKFTVREQIMQNLVAMFEAAPSDPANDIVWNLVLRKMISSDLLLEASYAVSFFDTTEKITYGNGYDLYTFRLIAEFHVHIVQNDEPGTYLNHALGQVKKRIGEDETIGGLVLNLKGVGSELDMDGPFDNYVSGVAAFDVSYRCRPNDPYTRL